MIVTIKYNSAGVQQWAAVYNGASSGSDQGKALALDNYRNVYVTGWSTGSSSNHDYMTIKYDSSGSQQWAMSYNGPGNGIDEAELIAVNDSGNVFITGYSTGSVTGNDWATIKYSGSGTQQWVQRYTGFGNNGDRPNGLALDSWGSVYM
jgi:hypothetical protein